MEYGTNMEQICVRIKEVTMNIYDPGVCTY